MDRGFMSQDPEDLKARLFSLIKKEAFLQKKVVLSSGRISKYYIDIRRISLTAEGAFLIANLFWPEIIREKVKTVGGPTLGADPILSGLAYHSYIENKALNTFIVRKEKKKHGQKNLIEGPPLRRNQRVILIDDVATSGKSLLEALNSLRERKVKVVKALVVVDREEGAGKLLKFYRCPLVSLFRLKDFL